VNSSLWNERDDVRLLFITLLAVCDREGYVYGSRQGLERLANITYSEDESDPWHVLMSPDPDSSDRLRNPENEGRRIEEVPGGFRLLNFGYYRGLRNDDDRREQNRRAQEKRRGKPKSAGVSQGQPASAGVSQDKPISEAEAEAEAEERGTVPAPSAPRVRKGFEKPSYEEVVAYAGEGGAKYVERFYAYYVANGWKVGRNPMKSWKAAFAGWEAREREEGR
jgi:hypothetical protein